MDLQLKEDGQNDTLPAFCNKTPWCSGRVGAFNLSLGLQNEHWVQAMGEMNLKSDMDINANGCYLNKEPGVANMGEEMNAVSIHRSSINRRYNKNNEGGKQVFHIPPMMIFLKAIESIGVTDMSISNVRSGELFQVQIMMNTNLPLCLQPGSNYAEITGEVCATYELAEGSAINKAFDHLYNMHNVVLVDISYRKKADHTHKARNLFCDVVDGLRVVGNMIQNWNYCMDLLYQVEKLAYQKKEYGNEAESSIATYLLTTINSIKEEAMGKIRSSHQKLKALESKKDDYERHAIVHKEFFRKASIIKAYHPEECVLNLMARWLRLYECQFCAAPVDGERFLGAVMISYPATQDIVPAGETCVEADREESTIEEAKNRAAKQAIYRLENEFNVEIVGMKHNDTVRAEQEMLVISGLKDKILFLGSIIIKDWKNSISRIDDSIHATKDAVAGHGKGPGFYAAVPFANTQLSEHELAAAKCRGLSVEYSEKFSSLL